jgi:hypothetical protein
LDKTPIFENQEFNGIKQTVMSASQKEKDLQNYRNFGLALIGIVGIMIFILIVGAVAHFGFLNGVKDGAGLDSPAYNAGRAAGYSLKLFINFYFNSGLFFGVIFALVASLEKKNSFGKVLIHGLFGWGYVIYYALTRKTLQTAEAKKLNLNKK